VHFLSVAALAACALALLLREPAYSLAAWWAHGVALLALALIAWDYLIGPGMQAIVKLIHQVDKEEPIEKLENTLKLDPALAFKLLRYINSPAFGLRVEISSFRHAIMMLGYKRLKRWLALLLATASKDVNLRPVMFAAVRRGLLMEELVRSTGDEEMRNEMFICGVFSLLDRMFQQPFATLLDTIPPPLLASRSIIWDFFLFMSTGKAAIISAPTVLTPIHSSIRAAITARSTTSPMSCTISMTCWRQRNC